MSVSVVRKAGQFKPFVKQTVEPLTVSVPKVPLLAFSWVVEAMPLTNKLVLLTLVAVVF